jgi:rhodanese-related sulfurtransferase
METWHVVLLVVFAFLVWRMIAARPDIDSARARSLVKEGAKLVDVRSPGEFAAGHIEGAVNIPVGEIGARIGDVGKSQDTVVLYCASGMRSAQAAKVLRASGFDKVHNLGGMRNW